MPPGAQVRGGEMIRGNGNHLDVGFLGMPHLMDVLCRWNHAD